MRKQSSDFPNSKPKGSPDRRVPTPRWQVVKHSMQQELQPQRGFTFHTEFQREIWTNDCRPASVVLHRENPHKRSEVTAVPCPHQQSRMSISGQFPYTVWHMADNLKKEQESVIVATAVAGGRRERHAIRKTGFLTLMTGFQQIPLPACSSSTWPKLPASSPMKATAGCSSQSGTHARS